MCATFTCYSTKLEPALGARGLLLRNTENQGGLASEKWIVWKKKTNNKVIKNNGHYTRALLTPKRLLHFTKRMPTSNSIRGLNSHNGVFHSGLARSLARIPSRAFSVTILQLG